MALWRPHSKRTRHFKAGLCSLVPYSYQYPSLRNYDRESVYHGIEESQRIIIMSPPQRDRPLNDAECARMDAVPEICGGEMAHDEAFVDREQLLDFLGLLMRHWDSIVRILHEEDVFAPLLLPR
jgi:hypothetical protein